MQRTDRIQRNKDRQTCSRSKGSSPTPTSPELHELEWLELRKQPTVDLQRRHTPQLFWHELRLAEAFPNPPGKINVVGIFKSVGEQAFSSS